MNDSPMTFCISTFNNLNYLKLAVHSVRTYSHFKDAPIVIYAENCNEETTEWLHKKAPLEYGKVGIENYYVVSSIDKQILAKGGNKDGIGGGMNVCADIAKKEFDTKYLMFLHADFFVSQDWDLAALKIFDKYPNTPMWVSSQRFQPNLFHEESRPGTLIFPYSEFGCKSNDFKEQYFIEYAAEFSKLNPDIEYEKGEGVSGLIRQEDWDYIGGNDPIYAPAYWEDTDLFLRMQLAGYKFVLTSNSVVFHFGSRSGSSNFSSDNAIVDHGLVPAVRSELSRNYERNSAESFFKKWNFWPAKNHHDFVTIPENVDRSKLKHLIRLNDTVQP
jgi:GT2 family glycosyltransferase